MLDDPELLGAYNDLKRHDGSDYGTYTDAKAEFIQRVVRAPAGDAV